MNISPALQTPDNSSDIDHSLPQKYSKSRTADVLNSRTLEANIKNRSSNGISDSIREQDNRYHMKGPFLFRPKLSSFQRMDRMEGVSPIPVLFSSANVIDGSSNKVPGGRLLSTSPTSESNINERMKSHNVSMLSGQKKNFSDSSLQQTRWLRPGPPSISPILDIYEHNFCRRYSVSLLEAYLEQSSNCGQAFPYELRFNPKRVLTRPSKGTHNGGVDNDNHDYILYVNDVFGNEEGRKFIILDLLGHGTFGQVVKCQNLKSKDVVAIKIIKNQTAYFNQSMMEVTILEMLNTKYDTDDLHHITRMKDTFIYKRHLCIVFELLSLNLFELIKQNHFKGFHHQIVRVFLRQVVDAMTLLKDAKIIHCDLKPENILLREMDSPEIKVIDFGSACHEQQTVYTYIQSRFYRSPEVLLGLPYSASIDVWSLGCITAELFLGLPLFPGSSNYDQVFRIVNCLGMPPNHMIEKGKHAMMYFEKCGNEHRYQLKSREQFVAENRTKEKPFKRYFQADLLEDIVNQFPMPSHLDEEGISVEKNLRSSLLDLLRGLLELNPLERWTPKQIKGHPYLTGEYFNGPYIPPGSYIPTDVYMETTQKRIQRPRASTINSQLHVIPPQLQKLAVNAVEEKPIERRPSIYNQGHLASLQPHAKVIQGSPPSYPAGYWTLAQQQLSGFSFPDEHGLWSPPSGLSYRRYSKPGPGAMYSPMYHESPLRYYSTYDTGASLPVSSDRPLYWVSHESLEDTNLVPPSTIINPGSLPSGLFQIGEHHEFNPQLHSYSQLGLQNLLSSRVPPLTHSVQQRRTSHPATMNVNKDERK